MRQQVAVAGRVLVVELRAALDALAVDAAEVEPRGVVVPHGQRVLQPAGQRRLVQRHVVVDELAEVDVAGRDPRVVERDVAVLDVGQRRLAVVHARGQRVQQPVRRGEAGSALNMSPKRASRSGPPGPRCPPRAGRRRRARP